MLEENVIMPLSCNTVVSSQIVVSDQKHLLSDAVKRGWKNITWEFTELSAGNSTAK